MTSSSRAQDCLDAAEDRVFLEIAQLLMGVSQAMKAHFHAIVEEHEVTPPQAMALNQLVEQPLSMRQIAKGLHCDASYVTSIADRLEERDLVRRQPSATDRRVKTLVVTEAGAQLRQQLWEQLASDFPGPSRLTEDERLSLLTLLRKMIGPEELEQVMGQKTADALGAEEEQRAPAPST